MAKVLVTQLGSTASAQKKHYTIVMLPGGSVLVNYGGRSFKSTGAIEIVPGKVIPHMFSKFSDGKTKYNTLFGSKMGSSDYNQLIVDHKIIDIPDDLIKAGFNTGNLFKAVYNALPETQRISNATPTKPRGVWGTNNSNQMALFEKIASNGVTPSPASTAANTTSVPKTVPEPAPQTFLTNVEAKVIRPNGDIYHPREVMGHTDVALLRAFREKNIYVRLAGSPGSGKTALAEGAFPDLVTVSGHGDMTVAHFVGTHIPLKDGGWQWQDGPLVRAMREGRPLFVDEGTRIPTEVLNILFSVMDGRNILRIDDNPAMPVVHGAKGFYVLMGYNPETLGARALDEALVSRFRVQIDVETDFATARILKVPTLPIKIAKNLKTRDIEDKKREGTGVWVPQMRELLTYRDLIQMNAGEDFALATLLASCPRSSDIPIVKAAIQAATKKEIDVPSLGGIV